MSFRFNDRTYHVDADHATDPYSSARHKGGAYVFYFGVYTPAGVIVFANSLENGLEIGAESGHAGGAMTDGPDYKDAAEDAGLTLKSGDLYDADGEYVDWDSTEGNDVRESAEADLTYTEAGWLTWEWSVNDLDYGEPLYGDAVAVWVKDNPDWVDDSEEDVRDVLVAAGASDTRVKAALKALRDHYGE